MSFQWRDTLDSEGLEKSSQTILEEVTIENEQITEQDVMTYAKIIGIEPRSEKALLWIARQGLLSNLPPDWIAVKDSSERIYYYNHETGESRWDHPLDTYYRKLAQIERNKLNKIKSTMNLADVHFLDDKLTLSAEISDSVESIQFELDEFNEEIDDEKSGEKTLDITDGGIEDVKQFEEIYNINLQKETDKNDKYFPSEETNNDIFTQMQTMKGNIKSVKHLKTSKDLYSIPKKLETNEVILDDNDEYLEEEEYKEKEDENEIEDDKEIEEIEVEELEEEEERDEAEIGNEHEQIEKKNFEDIERNLELIKFDMNAKIESMKEELKILINEHKNEFKNEIQSELEDKLASCVRKEVLKNSHAKKRNDTNEINEIIKEIDLLKIRMDGNDNDSNKWIKNQWKKMNEAVEDIEKGLIDYQERFNDHRKNNELVLKSLKTELSKIDNKHDCLMDKLSELMNQSDKLIKRIDKIEDKVNDYQKDMKDLKNSLNSELNKIKSENESKNEERFKLVEDNFKNKLEEELANLKDDYEIIKTYLQQEVDKIEQTSHEKDDFSLKERLINLENGIKQISDKLPVKMEEPFKTSNHNISNSESSQISLNGKSCKCCKHCYYGNRSFLLTNENDLIKGPMHSIYSDNYTHLKDIRASSLSLISLIQNTSKLLKEEAKQLESIGNYHFISDINTNFLHRTNNSDEITVRRLKLIRNDINEKLKKLDNILVKKKFLDE